jgi:hypothetical protein
MSCDAVGSIEVQGSSLPRNSHGTKIVNSLRQRLVLAAATGIVAAVLLYAVTIRHPNVVALDYTWHWRAARALLDGQNPYRVIQPVGAYPYSAGYYYPLPAAFLALPFAQLPANIAAALSVGIAAFVFTLSVTGESLSRWPLLLSSPMFGAVVTGQFTVPLIAAALAWPSMQVLAIAKPNLGIAVSAARPSRWSLVGGAVTVLIAFVLVPSWLTDWIRVIRADPGVHVAPIRVVGGAAMLVAVARWRNANARLLLVMSMVPQTMTFYDTLPVVLCARTFRQSLVIALTSQLAMVLAVPYAAHIESQPAIFQGTAWLALVGIYLPALLFVLREPYGHGHPQNGASVEPRHSKQ